MWRIMNPLRGLIVYGLRFSTTIIKPLQGFIINIVLTVKKKLY
jgi:hypothetical protein